MLVARLRFWSTFARLLPVVLALTAWNTLAVLAHVTLHDPQVMGITSSWPDEVMSAMLWSQAGVPFAAIGALGGALAIFLGFRNNSAYDRWWEARKIWGALVNDSRSWCRQVVAWVEPPLADADDESAAQALRRELVHRHLAFVHGLALHLRHASNLVERIAHFLPPAEVEVYRRVPNVPTALLIEQGKAVARARTSGQIEHFRHLRMDVLLTRLSDIQGRCERIKNTPLPRQYDSFPRWFLNFYGFILPFGLIDSVGWAAVPLSVTITLLFISLETAGRIIEDPFEGTFSDTPMTALSVTIERDLRAALAEPLPDAVRPDRHGILM